MSETRRYQADRINDLMKNNFPNAEVSSNESAPLVLPMVTPALQQELAKHVEKEDEHRFRCKVPGCIKLFQEHCFWEKHVLLRHPEWVEALKSDLHARRCLVASGRRLRRVEAELRERAAAKLRDAEAET